MVTLPGAMGSRSNRAVAVAVVVVVDVVVVR